MVNGSSKPNGCTATALQEIAKVLREEGIDSEIVCLGGGPLRDCIGCLGCTKLDGQCAFNDDCINEILEKAKTCDGFILVRRFIMRIRAAECCLHWIGCSTQAKNILCISRAQQSPLQEEPVQRLPSMH